jgi:hypothetical protein
MTQDTKVQNYLLKHGIVTRNWALRNYITRLGAIMFALKQGGIKFEAKWSRDKKGKRTRDYE